MKKLSLDKFENIRGGGALCHGLAILVLPSIHLGCAMSTIDDWFD
ncbi:MAG: hypothetical protein ACK5IC_08880 [Moheibacter sp.]